MTPDKNDDTVLLRLPGKLKAALLTEAAKNGRRITAEINIRLTDSLNQDTPTNTAAKVTTYSRATPVKALTTGEPGGEPTLSDLDAAMLKVFHSLPVDKQLALLSLFK